ncbi:MAG: histidine phosphatase family protein [Pirellulales bacterium]|nr:histidine phosphatase family protein [Pirellulales bacterium]
MILYLIRHGESIYNAEGRVQGQSDAPLSELGRRQSRAVADAMAYRPIDAIYSSPLRRAYAVAKDIASRHGLPVRTDPRLKEIAVGEFQDRMRTELEEEHPEELARWWTGDMDYAFPGGETRRQLADRGEEAFQEIASNGHRNAVVVAHGGLLVHTLRRLVDAPKDSLFGLRNCSITKLRTDGHGRFELVSFDEVDHLGEVGVSLGKDL